MALILSIETSTKVCSVAIHNDGIQLGLTEFYIDKSHSSVLLAQIHHLVNCLDIKLKSLKAIALSDGPGSYTGLRIGTATAKGLCFALDIPLIAVDTLYAMCIGIRNFNTEHYYMCPMLDARRMEVYAAIYDYDLNKLLDTKPLILDSQIFEQYLINHKIIFFGDGSPKFKKLAEGNQNFLFIKNIFPSATYIGEVAINNFNNNLFEDIAYYEPNYLKEFLITTKLNG